MLKKTQALGSKDKKQSDSQAGIIIDSIDFKRLKKDNSVPIKIIPNSDLGMKGISQPLKNAQLELGKGVEIIMKDNVVYIKSKSWFMYFFGIAVIFSVILIITAAIFLRKPETKIIFKERIVKNSVQSKKQELSKSSNKKTALKSDEDEKVLKTYKSLKEVFEVIEFDPEASIKIFKEAVSLRKQGNEEEEFNRKESRKLYKKAIIRLRALLKKGEISNIYRLRTAYQLWAIYHCHLKWKKAAKEMKTLVKIYNRKVKHRKSFMCPKL